jgi:phosphoribosyl-AMP cyclohydrolase / phosphoribosyl-ATP pyrophosphohydrolase
MTREDIQGLNWEKGHGLLPAIVQHSSTGTVLMTGYVNKEALHLMLERRQVVLYSRTRQRLWIKGETSGNHIRLERIVPDCDRDALLVLALPSGPVCHTGAQTCFPGAQPGSAGIAFLADLERTIAERMALPVPGSYTASLVAGGVRRVAQKVGEEAVEVVLATTGTQEELVSESADLIFHLIVLLKSRGIGLADIAQLLESRRKPLTRPQAPVANSQ